ncbi:MFS transporter [Amycolatopsis anabasis]|uniref:MFS transporter n=1 Tax=Amycolatopsis anabasis TaxID=1840409 RepID=UPI00131A916A|nr:MFS transporter [Amycolatopsis anabasis]
MRGRYQLVRYLGGAALARTGDEMSGPALLLLGLAVTGSATAASALLAGLTVSAAVGGPVFGALLDRSPRPGRLLAGALVAYAAGLAAILGGLGHVPVAAAVAAAVLTGLLNPALTGGWTAQLPHVLGGTPLERGSALDALTFTAASLAGPALAGLAAQLLGAPVAVAAAIALVALATPAAWFLPRRPAPARATNLGRELAAGFAAIAARRTLLRATAASAVSFAGVGMLTVCCPLLGEQRLGGAARGTLLLTVIAVAALLANAALARRPPKPDATVLVSVLALVASTALAAVSSSAALLVAAAALAGLSEGPQLTALFAIRHREAPDHLRAQIFSTGASVKITGFALGSAIAGPLATWSVTACLLAAAAVELTAALAYLALGRARRP